MKKKNEYSNLTFKFLLLVWSDFKADKPNIWEEIKDNHSAACLCSDKLKNFSHGKSVTYN